MKVLNVNMLIDPVTGGGTAERTLQMSRHLAREGVECSILAMDLGITNSLEDSLKGIRVIKLPCMNKRFYFPKLSLSVMKMITESVYSVDIVHIMGHWTVLNALVFWAVQRLGKPYVVCPAGALPLFGRSILIKRIYNRIVGYRLIRGAARCIAVTEDEIPYFQEYGVKKENGITIPNGIDPERYVDNDTQAFRKKHGLGFAPFVLFVGRLNLIKGPDLLLNAFCHIAEQFESYHLVFAGGDEGMLRDLKACAADNCLSNRVHFPGFISGDEKSRAFHTASLLAIPSRKEAMSIVVLEAGITGTPVLLTDQCGFGHVGRLNAGKVVPATVDGVSTGLIELLQSSNQLSTMGQNLKEFVHENFLWSVIVHRYIDLFKKICERSTGL